MSHPLKPGICSEFNQTIMNDHHEDCGHQRKEEE